jgi:hypothetical protein
VPARSGRDFQLQLTGGISEQELQRRRMALLDAYEQQRLAELRTEEESIYSAWMSAAESAAADAREAFHERRLEQLRAEAEAVVAYRRGAALQKIVSAEKKEGVYGWPEGLPEAGEQCCQCFHARHGTALLPPWG